MKETCVLQHTFSRHFRHFIAMYGHCLLLLVMMMTVCGTAQSTSTNISTVTTITTVPASSHVAGLSQETSSPNTQSPLCDGFECREDEYCSTSNTPMFAPRCRGCSTVNAKCGDMAAITKMYKGCEAYCLNLQRNELIANCTHEKSFLSKKLSGCKENTSRGVGELKTTQMQLTDAEATIADLKRQIKNLTSENYILRSEKSSLEDKTSEMEKKYTVLVSILVPVLCFMALMIPGVLCLRSLVSRCRKVGTMKTILEKLPDDCKRPENSLSKLVVVTFPETQGDPEAPPVSRDSTLVKPPAGNAPVEAHLNEDNSRNLVAPTGDRTERMRGDENDFCQSLRHQTQYSNSADNVTCNTNMDPTMFPTCNVTNVGTSWPVSETAGPDRQWSAIPSSDFTSSNKAGSEVMQPLLKSSQSRAHAKQPVEGKEKHNSKYRYGSNESLRDLK